jgi:hypothetical protein
MKQKYLLIILLFLSSVQLYSQNEFDALRYSQYNISGTARYSSMSGAFGSLGGNFSGLSQNPAGLGMYQFTEVTFTPQINSNINTSYYNSSVDMQRFETESSDGKIGNIGLVLSYAKDDPDWKRINFGIGWNQIANYNKNIYIFNENTSSSLADNFLSIAQGNQINELNSFFASPAFWTDIIDLANNSFDSNGYIYDNGNYISHVSGATSKNQIHMLNANGGMNEFVLSLGSSYQEKFYLGATLGFPTLNYTESVKHTETNFEDTINGLESFSYAQDLIANGTGINLKIGGIYRLNEQIKIGGALHSPTLFTMQEEFQTLTSARFMDTSYYEYSPNNFFEYNLTTPWKAIASISAKLMNSIFSIDYELIDYTTASLDVDNYYMDNGSQVFNDENNAITNTFTKTENIKVGAETKLEKLSLRAGYAKFGSPLRDDYDEELSRENFSFGIGLNNGSYYIDFAYIFSEYNEKYQMYSEEFVSASELVNSNHNILLTLGFRY